MKIEDILKKQGELYKNLPRNKTIQKCSEKIEKPTELLVEKQKKDKKLQELFCREANLLEELIDLAKTKEEKSILGERAGCILKYVSMLDYETLTEKELDRFEREVDKLEELRNAYALKYNK